MRVCAPAPRFAAALVTTGLPVSWLVPTAAAPPMIVTLPVGAGSASGAFGLVFRLARQLEYDSAFVADICTPTVTLCPTAICAGPGISSPATGENNDAGHEYGGSKVAGLTLVTATPVPLILGPKFTASGPRVTFEYSAVTSELLIPSTCTGARDTRDIPAGFDCRMCRSARSLRY